MKKCINFQSHSCEVQTLFTESANPQRAHRVIITRVGRKVSEWLETTVGQQKPSLRTRFIQLTLEKSGEISQLTCIYLMIASEGFGEQLIWRTVLHLCF